MKRIFEFMAVILTVALAALGLTFWNINRDRTPVFFEVAGDIGEVKTISSRSSDTSEIREISIQNTRGEFLVECWYRRPRVLSPNYRVLLVYSGVKTKDAVLDLIPDRPDVVLCAVQYPYQRPLTFLEYVRWPRDVRRAAYRTVAGGFLATTFLIEREKYDPSRLTLVGASLGSIFGGIQGAIDSRIPRVLIVHGGGNFPVIARASPRLRERGWPVRVSAWIGNQMFGSFDPVRYVGRIAPRELVVIATRNDLYFPPQSALSLMDAAGEPKKIIWMESPHVRSEKSEVVNEIIRSINTYLFPDTAPSLLPRP